MEMKGIMFAGVGLFVAMSLTVVAMRGDVTRMRNEANAREAAECAAQASQAPASTDPYAAPEGGGFVTSDTFADDAAGSDGGPSCPPPTDGGAVADPYAQGDQAAQATADPYAAAPADAAAQGDYPADGDYSTGDYGSQPSTAPADPGVGTGM
jgi:hypothetical protein